MGEQSQPTTVYSGSDITRATTRIAHEILERNRGASNIVLLGIPTRGVPFAQRIAQKISEVEPGVSPSDILGTLDVTLHRDDLSRQPVRALQETTIPPRGVDDRVVVLIDDVLFSGRTIRAALDAITEIGRPQAVQLAVLIDRGHRELPIRADFIGKNIPTSRKERVAVSFQEIDGEDLVQVIA